MDKKILFISEVLTPPFDEGIKNVAFSIHKNLAGKSHTLSVTKGKGSRDYPEIHAVPLNKLFLNYGLNRLLASYAPDYILYLPEASITVNSFLRARVLKWMSRYSKVIVLGIKQVDYAPVQRKLIARYFRPDCLLLTSRFDRDFFSENGVPVNILPPAVDNVRFCPAMPGEKEKIRSEFGIPADKRVVLHVGHIRPTRNVQCFSKIQEIENTQVVIIGSTSTPTENDLKEQLERDGVLVIDKYIPDITKVYKMSDMYIFPVFNKIACIDMPLSILEAMACNLPVITTRFGVLEEYFEEDKGFIYCNTEDQLVGLISNFNLIGINNSAKVSRFTWDLFSHEVMEACYKLL